MYVYIYIYTHIHTHTCTPSLGRKIPPRELFPGAGFETRSSTGASPFWPSSCAETFLGGLGPRGTKPLTSSATSTDYTARRIHEARIGELGGST